MSLSVEECKPWYSLIGDLASGAVVYYHLVIYGGEKFVSKNVSKI
jgi:hypothetical protein